MLQQKLGSVKILGGGSTETTSTVVSTGSSIRTLARSDTISKEQWAEYKSQIQGLNERFESSLVTLKNTYQIERSNVQLVELWQKAAEDKRKLMLEIEHLRKNEKYREMLELAKIELEKLYNENYELRRTNQDLRMENDELNLKIISLERRIQLLENQMLEEANIQKRLADELKFELANAQTTISGLMADCQRYAEMAVELEAEIATYKMLLKKLNEIEAISSVVTTVLQESTVTQHMTTVKGQEQITKVVVHERHSGSESD